MIDKKIQDIFASRQTGKILTAELSSVGVYPFKSKNKDTGEEIEKKILCGIIFYGETTVYIPINLMNISHEDQQVLRSMIGATVDFIVVKLNEKEHIAFASRKRAMEIRRIIELPKHKEGDIVPVRITAIGLNKIIAEVYGVEVYIRRKEAGWGYIPDLTRVAQVGDIRKAKIIKLDLQELDQIIVDFDKKDNGLVKINSEQQPDLNEQNPPSSDDIEDNASENTLINKVNSALQVSLRQAVEDPYIKAVKKIKKYNEYECVITGIKSYGLFFEVKHMEAISILCSYPRWTDFTPQLGDVCCIEVSRIREDERKIDGRLKRFIRHK